MHALVLRPKRSWSLLHPNSMYATMGMVLPVVDTECPDRDALTGRPLRILVGPNFRIVAEPEETWLLNKEEEGKFLRTHGGRYHTGTFLENCEEQARHLEACGIMSQYDREMLALLKNEGPSIHLVRKAYYKEAFDIVPRKGYHIYFGELFSSTLYGGTLHSSLFKFICPMSLEGSFFPTTPETVIDDVEINSEDY